MGGSSLSVSKKIADPVDGVARNVLTGSVMEWADWSDACERTESWLNDIYQRLRAGAVEASMEALYQGLHLLHRRWDREEWREFCLEVARLHRLRELLHQCPYSHYAFERPRGYAGDAVLIDHVYSLRETASSPLGRAIYHFLYEQPGPRSVRERRVLLGREIDAVAAEVPRPRILSVACGHMREVELSQAVAERRIGEIIAFDQDVLSLEEVRRMNPGDFVRPVCDTVRSIVLGRHVFQGMDLIYSAGLYDYLSECIARRLTRQLFGMLRSGGRLMVANFATSTPDAGYLEAFMDWWLVYRDEQQMQALTSEIEPGEIARLHMFRDSVSNVIYMELTRR